MFAACFAFGGARDSLLTRGGRVREISRKTRYIDRREKRKREREGVCLSTRSREIYNAATSNENSRNYSGSRSRLKAETQYIRSISRYYSKEGNYRGRAANPRSIVFARAGAIPFVMLFITPRLGSSRIIQTILSDL